MSKISEYLKLIPAGIEHREEIFDSIVNSVKMRLGTIPEDEQEEIIRRRAICEGCNYNSKNAKKAGYETKRGDDHCILCNCSILLKTASLMSQCGAEIWNLKNEPKIPLKWEVYKSK